MLFKMYRKIKITIKTLWLFVKYNFSHLFIKNIKKYYSNFIGLIKMKKLEEDMKNFFGRFPAKTFANDACQIFGAYCSIGIVKTEDGLVVFDLSIKRYGKRVLEEIRKFSDKPIKYIINSHGHFDHVFGFTKILKEIKESGWDMPTPFSLAALDLDHSSVASSLSISV